MSRTLYCRWEHCGWNGEIVAGFFPPHCPRCKRESRWNVGPPTTFESQPRPFRLTKDDKDFLRVNKIAPFEDDDDGA